MIRNEQEYKQAIERLQDEHDRIKNKRQELTGQGFSDEEVKRALDPVMSFHLQLREEAESYERLKQGQIDELRNLRGLGHMLICLRIAANVSQRELADRLGVHESQISRDERNEYHGVTLERAAKIIEALNVRIRLQATVGTGEMSLDDPVLA